MLKKFYNCLGFRHFNDLFIVESLFISLKIKSMSKLTVKAGKKIADIRIEKGLSQQELADLSKLQVAYVGRVELGKYSIGLDNFNKICKALDVKMSDILLAIENKKQLL